MNESGLDPVAYKKILKFATLGDLGTARRDCTGIMGLGSLSGILQGFLEKLPCESFSFCLAETMGSSYNPYIIQILTTPPHPEEEDQVRAQGSGVGSYCNPAGP